jgi:hypothetical protein
MSHISKIETKIKDLAMLKKALEKLGMACVEAEEGKRLTLLGYGKDEVIEDCVMEIKTGSKYGIGIRKVGEQYEVVADWWAIETFTGEKQEDIMNRITRRYAYETVMDKVHSMGYDLVQEEQDAKNNLRITVRRWG